MALGNFSRDIQSKAEAPIRVAFVLVIGAPLQRIKDLVEVRLLDDRAAIPDFEDNPCGIPI
jgi:hypothetical protein